MRICLLFLVLTAVIPVQAATSTILGQSENALACYHTAKRLAQSINDLLPSTEQCDLALAEFLSSKDKASTLVNRGLIHARLEKFDLALQDYDAAIKINERVKPIALINIGNAYFLQQDFTAATSYYTKALALDVKQDHAATLNRGMAWEKLGKLEAAEQDYLAALQLIPEWESALIRLERVRRKMDEHAH